MKKYTVLAVLALLATSVALAQHKWELLRTMTLGTVKSGSGIHGIAVDHEGKLWVAPFSRTEPVGDGTNTVCLYAFNRDLTPASFSPIKFLVGPGFTDTLKGNGCRGISVDKDGNIVGTWATTMYRIDSKTGAALNKVIPEAKSQTQPVCDVDNGYIYVGTVLSGSPIRIYNSDFTLAGNAVDNIDVIVRSYGVNRSGTDLYQGDLSTKKCAVYHSDFPGILQHALTDSLMVGGTPSAFGWQPGTGWLWMDAGNPTNEIPNAPWTPLMYYAFDVATKEVKDSLMIDTVKAQFLPPAVAYNSRGRGIAFSVTGDTAYIALFNVDTNHVQIFTKVAADVKPVSDVVPATYALSQNYPNPFNPTTEINFSLPKGGMTTIVVYDVLGKEVATLVNETLAPGSYRTSFNGSRLASGTYVYTLVSGDVRISKKMMLVK